MKATMQFSEILARNNLDPKKFIDDEQKEILED